MRQMAEEIEDGTSAWSMGVFTGMTCVVDGPGSGAAGVAAERCKVIVVTIHGVGDGADKEHSTSLE